MTGELKSHAYWCKSLRSDTETGCECDCQDSTRPTPGERLLRASEVENMLVINAGLFKQFRYADDLVAALKHLPDQALPSHAGEVGELREALEGVDNAQEHAVYNSVHSDGETGIKWALEAEKLGKAGAILRALDKEGGE